MSNESKQNLNQSGPWWKPAMQIFSEISTWIAVPIILALIVGKALDAHYDTKPYLFLACAGIGFLSSAYGIVKSVKDFNNKMQSPNPSSRGGQALSRGPLGIPPSPLQGEGQRGEVEGLNSN